MNALPQRSRLLERWYVAAAVMSLSIGVFGSAGAAPSQNLPAGVFAGTIGGSDAVVEIGMSSETEFFDSLPAQISKMPGRPFRAQYFYRAHGVGIVLAGNAGSDGLITMTEFGRDNSGDVRATGDTWQIHAAGDGLSGSFLSPALKAPLPITLRRVGTLAHDSRAGENAAAYYRELLASAPTRGARITTNSGASYQTLTDTRFHISTIDITSMPSATSRVAANAALTATFNEHRSNASDCLTSIMFSGGNDYKETMHVSQFSRNALSLDIEASFFCGGAHPSVDFDPISIDLRNGKPIDWDRAVSRKIEVARFYQRSAPAAIRKAGIPNASECDDDYSGASGNPNVDFAYEIAPAGLLVRADFGHAAAVCDVNVIIPAAAARNMLAPAYRDLLS